MSHQCGLRPRRHRGSVLAEFPVVALLALLPVLLGVVQTALLLVAHHALSFAASEAARAGSVSNARLDAMYAGLAEGLVPLVGAGSQGEGGGLADYIAARLRAEAEVRLFASIQRLSPDTRDFEDHGVMVHGRRVIPNDSLEYRPATPGRSGGRSLQQANLLRLRIRYCQPLVVPFVDRLLVGVLSLLDTSAEDQLCYAANRLPLRVETSAPMQSAAWP